MSMRDYGVADYGLVIEDDAMQVIASKLCTDYSEEDWNDNQTGYEEEVADKCGLDYISQFSGEALYINDRGYTSYKEYTTYSDDPIYYLPLHFPTLFTPAYDSMEDLIDECKMSDVAKYLPEDFDYRNSVRYVVGTYYG